MSINDTFHGTWVQVSLKHIKGSESQDRFDVTLAHSHTWTLINLCDNYKRLCATLMRNDISDVTLAWPWSAYMNMYISVYIQIMFQLWKPIWTVVHTYIYVWYCDNGIRHCTTCRLDSSGIDEKLTTVNEHVMQHAPGSWDTHVSEHISCLSLIQCCRCYKQKVFGVDLLWNIPYLLFFTTGLRRCCCL